MSPLTQTVSRVSTLALLLIVAGGPGTRPVRAQQSPALRETLDWITARVAESRVTYVARGTAGTMVISASITFHGCVGTFTSHVQFGKSRDEAAGTVQLQLLGIPRVVRESAPAANGTTFEEWVVQLPSQSALRPAFAGKSFVQSPSRSRTVALPTSFRLGFAFTSAETAEDVRKAFMRAIDLCRGAKKD